MITYRSPKNLSEEDLNEALGRKPNKESQHSFNEWLRLTDSKEVLKAILASGLPWRPAVQLICLGLQAGFDLHAAIGDCGPAALYVPSEAQKEA